MASISRVPRSASIKAVFFDHPEAVGETYFEHMLAAMGFAFYLAVTAGAALVHALVPCLCETTTRRRIAVLNDKLQGRALDDGVSHEAGDK